jgi:hypothetical protein
MGAQAGFDGLGLRRPLLEIRLLFRGLLSMLNVLFD